MHTAARQIRILCHFGRHESDEELNENISTSRSDRVELKIPSERETLSTWEGSERRFLTHCEDSSTIKICRAYKKLLKSSP